MVEKARGCTTDERICTRDGGRQIQIGPHKICRVGHAIFAGYFFGVTEIDRRLFLLRLFFPQKSIVFYFQRIGVTSAQRILFGVILLYGQIGRADSIGKLTGSLENNRTKKVRDCLGISPYLLDGQGGTRRRIALCMESAGGLVCGVILQENGLTM